MQDGGQTIQRLHGPGRVRPRNHPSHHLLDLPQHSGDLGVVLDKGVDDRSQVGMLLPDGGEQVLVLASVMGTDGRADAEAVDAAGRRG